MHVQASWMQRAEVSAREGCRSRPRPYSLRHAALACAWPCVLLASVACDGAPEMSLVDPVNWRGCAARIPAGDSLAHAVTYLPVYSHIYSRTQRTDHDLTVTASVRNVSASDTLYLHRADYFDTGGEPIRTYFDYPIYVAPLETVEIVIDETDRAGGSGADVLVEWSVMPGVPEPLFEAVMISTNAQQGLSFTTRGLRA